MEIEPASIDQIGRAKDGRMIPIDADVGNVAKDLQAIDPHLRLRYSEAGKYFVVYLKSDQDTDEGDGHLVLTAQECDQRIVNRIREISQETYNYADELDKAEKKARDEADYRLSEKIGEHAERLAYEMRRELGYNDSRMYVSKEIPDEAA